jgi:uncharacterized membrane protein
MEGHTQKAMPQQFFTAQEQLQITAAIREAEKETSGEIRVHIDFSTEGLDVVRRAALKFDQLGMEKTKLRNAVLLFIAKDSRKLALWADKGINDVVPAGYWESTTDLMRSYFKAEQYAQGTIKAVAMIGSKLKDFFPIGDEDKNEITDDLSFG